MVAKLRGKPGGEHLSITMGDFADVPVEGTYRLIFVVSNTLFNLPTQDDQVRCFESLASHLSDDGLFVVETFVPSYLTRLRDDQYVDAEKVSVERVVFDVRRHDPVAQPLDESHVARSPEGLRCWPIVTRYGWGPANLTSWLGSRAATEGPLGRLGQREPFPATSRNHVSVYGP